MWTIFLTGFQSSRDGGREMSPPSWLLGAAEVDTVVFLSPHPEVGGMAELGKEV